MSSVKQAVLGIVGNRILQIAVIDRIEMINQRYMFFDILSESFTRSQWQPASKIQVDVGGWAMRTYTPLSFDEHACRIRLLSYLHGDSLAVSWMRGLAPGAQTHVAGPKASLPGLARPAIFFGDETSLPAAATIQTGELAPTPCWFEVDELDDSRAAIERLGLVNVTLVQRKADQSHLMDIARLIDERLQTLPTADLILTGNGRSIQALRGILRATKQTGIRQRVRAYWSPGKIGLD